MRYALSEFPSLPEIAVNAVAETGITDSDQLLNATATPKARRDLARKFNFDEEKLTQWASLADLVRVKGVGVAFAELFVQSKILKNVQDLVKSSGESENIYAALREYANENEFNGRLPSKGELEEIFSEARELRPRLVLVQDEGDQEAFRSERLKKVLDGHKHSFLYYGAIIGLTFLAIMVLYGLSVRYINDYIAEPIAANPQMDHLMREVFVLHFKAMRQSTLTIMVILFLFVILELLIYQLTTHFLETQLVFWMFQRPSEQAFFRKATSINTKRQSRFLWWAVVVFGLAAFGLALFAFRSMVFQGSSDEFFMGQVSRIIIFVGVFFGIVVSYPVIEFFLQMRKEGKDKESHLQKFLIYRFSQALLIPYVVILLTNIVLPQSLRLHDAFFQAQIEPAIRKEIIAVRDELASLEFDDQNDLASQQYLVAAINNVTLVEIETDYVFSDTAGQYLLNVILPIIVRAVIGLILTAYALLFVLPYFLLGGWKRGLLYTVILFVSFQTENFISNYAPNWFLLDEKSVSASLVIAFFVLANALLFDWIIDTRGKKICASCDTQLDEDVLFCHECGFMQE